MILLYRSILVSLFFFTSTLQALSHREANIWYFGDSAGIDFNSGAPVALTNSSLYASEACASISDSAGNLLFYTNSVIVYNANHNTMPNGTGLMGGSSPSQTAIVKKPGIDSLYYIFTLDDVANVDGLRYSIVDMSLDSGRGDIILSSKNTLLYTPTTEKITSIRHADGCDVWIITYAWNSDSFYVYLLSDTGLSLPVISNTGTALSGSISNGGGQMKASNDGKKIALTAGGGIGLVELYDFDNQTGYLSNPLSLTNSSSINIPWGISFSPDNSKLYVSTWQLPSLIVQFDLSAGDSAAIVGSMDTIASINNGYRSLQLAPDGKIYIAKVFNEYLGVINDPNNAGSACNFADSGLYLSGKLSMQGLPGFVESYFAKADFTFAYDTVCPGYSLAFNGSSPYTAIAWNWNFDDTASANNTDTTQNPLHSFSDTGVYNVQLIITGACKTDTVIKTIVVEPNTMVVSIGSDTILCYGASITLDANNSGSTYLWSTSDTTQTVIADTGTYYVQVTDKGCIKSDTITISQFAEIVVNLGNDTAICKGDSIVLDAGNSGNSYLWSTSDTTQTITIDSATIYFVEVFVNACSNLDTINISYSPDITVNLGNDTSICINATLTLDAENTGSSYLWSTSDTTQNITIDSIGTYSITVTDTNTCSNSDTINIGLSPDLTVKISNDTSICVNASLTLDAGNTGGSYLWSTNETTQTIIISSAGSYYIEVFNNGCSGSDTISISQLPEITVNIGNDTTINSGTSIYLSGTVAGGSIYSWSPPTGLSCSLCQKTLVNTKETITYVLSVTDTNGCISTDDIIINVDLTNLIFIPDIFSPNGDGNNDVLYMRSKGIENFRFAIYDRWGEKVFETTAKNVGWDGTFRGKSMSSAVFVYYVTGSFTNGGEINEKGHVALVR